MQQCQIPTEEVKMINSGLRVAHAIIHDIFNSTWFDNGSQQKASMHRSEWHGHQKSFFVPFQTQKNFLLQGPSVKKVLMEMQFLARKILIEIQWCVWSLPLYFRLQTRPFSMPGREQNIAPVASWRQLSPERENWQKVAQKSLWVTSIGAGYSKKKKRKKKERKQREKRKSKQTLAPKNWR